MGERDAEFWARFSHEWALWVLLVTLAVVTVAVVYSRATRSARTNSKALGFVHRSLQGLAGLTVLFFLFTQMHFPCAKIVQYRVKCMDQLRQISSAQFLYAGDHDERLATEDDWMAKLQLGGLKCPGALGPVSYAVNSRFVGQSLVDVDDPSHTVMIFDADDKSVGDASCLATDRHGGVSTYVSSDGSVRQANAYVRARLKW